jgi:NitT/TauT family transport system substrate-binding protein
MVNSVRDPRITRRASLQRLGGTLCAVGMPALLAPGRASAQAPLTVVKVGVLDSLSEAPTFLALDKGYFREEGLDVQFERFPNTADMVAPLSTGQLDVASGAPTLGLYNGALRGLPYKLVADKGRNSKGHGFNAIVVRKDLIESGKVKSAADLKGLKVATPSRHSPMEFQLELALKPAGLKLDDVTLEQLNFPNMIAAFSSKVIDAALLIEPFVALAARRGVGTKLIGVDEIYPDFQIAGIIYGPDFIKRSPEAAKRWMVGYVRGIREYLDATEGRKPKDELLASLARHTSNFKNPAALANVVFPGFNPDGYLHQKTITDSIDWYMARGLLRTRPQLGDLLDYQFLEYALGRLGRKGPAETVR